MSASPIKSTDLNAISDGATACDKLKELANTRNKMQAFLAWLLDLDGNLNADAGTNIKEKLFDTSADPGAPAGLQDAKLGWLVRTNPTTGALELVINNDKLGDILVPRALRINRLDTTDAVEGDLLRFSVGDWKRYSPVDGDPFTGAATIPDVSTGGLFYAAHNFGIKPRNFGAWIENITTPDSGYSLGDRIDVHSIFSYTGAAITQGTLTFCDANNVYVIFVKGDANYRILHRTTFDHAIITHPERWAIKLHASV